MNEGSSKVSRLKGRFSAVNEGIACATPLLECVRVECVCALDSRTRFRVTRRRRRYTDKMCVGGGGGVVCVLYARVSISVRVDLG